MNSLWSVIRNGMAVVAFFFWYAAISTSDYHVMVEGTKEPPIVGILLVLGVILMIPTVIHAVVVFGKGIVANVQNR